jgi:hypothetical protein
MGTDESDERIVSYSAAEIDAMIARGEDKTDWERVRKLTDAEIEASIDFEEEGEFDWDVVYLARGFERTEAIVTFRCDIDLLDWFQLHSDTPEAEIGEVLTNYVKGKRDRDER